MPRVLIVDDEPGIRFALKRWFERQAWDVSEAPDGTQALALLRAHAAPDSGGLQLIVCDLHLPGLSGADIVETLRLEQPTLLPRVILTTGDAVDAADHGSVVATHPHVLQKPFDLGMLRAAVDRVVNA